MLTRFRHRGAHARRGAVLVIAMVVLIVGIVLAMFSLTSSRHNITVSGQQRGKLDASYVAEAALGKALSKIRERVAADTWYWDYATTTTTPSYCSTNKNCLLDFYDPANDTLDNCANLYQWQDATEIMSARNSDKLVCNLLGSEMPEARVSVVRHQDYVDNLSGQIAHLIKATAYVKTPDNRLHKEQAVIVQILNTDQFFTKFPDKTVPAYIASKISLTN